MFVLGTAGHIDHGKSVLVKALTGIDPDRLREEKERGMTIDLGFAWLKLPSGREVGIVDVPGHERFIKNMLAGVGGIDIALLVVAANEGVMPQTREHLAILDLLEVPRGVVAVTKKDLVDDEWLSLVKMEIEELLSTTRLAGAKIIPVSATTGEGIPELKTAIDQTLSQAEPRSDRGRPRLPIDRVFTITGSGTIVTGTLIDGWLRVGQEVQIVPSGHRSRIRALQTHKAAVTQAEPGSRVAANLVGVTTSEVRRGDVLTVPGWLKPSEMLTARLRLLDYVKRPLRHNAEVSFFTGASEAIAKVRLLENDALEPGGETWAQIALAGPVVALRGDHFIIRSPVETLGGGRVVQAQALRLRRKRPDILKTLEASAEGSPEEALIAQLEPKQPLTLSVLKNLSAGDIKPLVETLASRGDLVAVGEGEAALYWTRAGWERLARQVAAVLKEYHEKFPARPGMPRLEFAGKLKLGQAATAVLARMASEQVLREEGGAVSLPEHKPRLTAAQQAKVDAFLKALAAQPYAPPSELIPAPELLGLLIARGEVLKASEGVVFSSAAYQEMTKRITAHIQAKGKITLAEVRDMFQTSRKYAQGLLEYLDAKKITRRVGDERVLY
ncbi:MAG: selenocysteine-specific translation elongation factor [Dehalococcoidia bacterium]|nr:MAG: selenocysteine-specific translation elongation factor [Dehalococcoidia bacterium]